MISTPIRFRISITFPLAPTFVAANPQDDGSWGFSIAPNDPINFPEFNGYFDLRSCLRDMFGNSGATVTQIAENLGCSANNCLCNQETIEAIVSKLSTQGPGELHRYSRGRYPDGDKCSVRLLREYGRPTDVNWNANYPAYMLCALANNFSRSWHNHGSIDRVEHSALFLRASKHKDMHYIAFDGTRG